MIAERPSNRPGSTRAVANDLTSAITVSTPGTTVYIDGIALSWYAMNEAVDTARKAPGVIEMVKKLVVAP